MPFLHCRCGGFNGMGRMLKDVPGKLRVSSWVHWNVAGCRQASWRAGMLYIARLSVLGWESLYNSNPRMMAHTCMGTKRELSSNLTRLWFNWYLTLTVTLLVARRTTGHLATDTLVRVIGSFKRLLLVFFPCENLSFRLSDSLKHPHILITNPPEENDFCTYRV